MDPEDEEYTAVLDYSGSPADYVDEDMNYWPMIPASFLPRKA